MDVINNVTAPDSAPNTASTKDGVPPCSRAIIDVSNAAIYWQAKVGNSPNMADWTPVGGSFMSPGSRRAPVSGTIYGFRFWAAVPLAQLPAGQTQAQVTVTLV
jgi:hypothetical protein